MVSMAVTSGCVMKLNSIAVVPNGLYHQRQHSDLFYKLILLQQQQQQQQQRRVGRVLIMSAGQNQNPIPISNSGSIAKSSSRRRRLSILPDWEELDTAAGITKALLFVGITWAVFLGVKSQVSNKISSLPKYKYAVTLNLLEQQHTPVPYFKQLLSSRRLCHCFRCLQKLLATGEILAFSIAFAITSVAVFAITCFDNEEEEKSGGNNKMLKSAMMPEIEKRWRARIIASSTGKKRRMLVMGVAMATFLAFKFQVMDTILHKLYASYPVMLNPEEEEHKDNASDCFCYSCLTNEFTVKEAISIPLSMVIVTVPGFAYVSSAHHRYLKKVEDELYRQIKKEMELGSSAQGF